MPENVKYMHLTTRGHKTMIADVRQKSPRDKLPCQENHIYLNYTNLNQASITCLLAKGTRLLPKHCYFV